MFPFLRTENLRSVQGAPLRAVFPVKKFEGSLFFPVV